MGCFEWRLLKPYCMVDSSSSTLRHLQEEEPKVGLPDYLEKYFWTSYGRIFEAKRDRIIFNLFKLLNLPKLKYWLCLDFIKCWHLYWAFNHHRIANLGWVKEVIKMEKMYLYKPIKWIDKITNYPFERSSRACPFSRKCCRLWFCRRRITAWNISVHRRDPYTW